MWLSRNLSMTEAGSNCMTFESIIFVIIFVFSALAGGITCETVTVYVVEKTGSYRVTFYFEAISHHALE